MRCSHGLVWSTLWLAEQPPDCSLERDPFFLGRPSCLPSRPSTDPSPSHREGVVSPAQSCPPSVLMALYKISQAVSSLMLSRAPGFHGQSDMKFIVLVRLEKA